MESTISNHRPLSGKLSFSVEFFSPINPVIHVSIYTPMYIFKNYMCVIIRGIITLPRLNKMQSTQFFLTLAQNVSDACLLKFSFLVEIIKRAALRQAVLTRQRHKNI